MRLARASGDLDDAVCDRTGSPPPPPPSVAADAALVSRIAEKFQADRPNLQPAALAPPMEPARTKTIREVYDAYMADPGAIRSGKTILAYELTDIFHVDSVWQLAPSLAAAIPATDDGLVALGGWVRQRMGLG
jgi:hypothetical protein